MRARLGDTVILCDGNAVEYTATITGFGDECVEFRVEPGYPSAAEPSVEVTLLAGYPGQDKLEQIIKHGVELGAAHIVPFFSRYWCAPQKEEQKNERYNRIAVKPPSSAAGAFCRMWPCRWQTWCRVPYLCTVRPLCLPMRVRRRAPCATCWPQQSPPMVKN